MPLPNLVIGGAPKSGTTSLYRWLVDHPDVYSASTKETFYLADRGTPYWNPQSNYDDHDLAGYRRFFRHCPDDAPWVVEGTTHYLYHRTARRVLSRLEPRPQVIFVLRQPAKRIYSSFKFTQNSRGDLDSRMEFQRFVDCLLTGRAASLRPWFHSERAYYALCNELGNSCYFDHLDRWRSEFGSSGLHLLTFEGLVQEPHQAVAGLAARLGLDARFYEGYDFPRENATFGVRSHALHRWVRRLAEVVPRVRATVAIYELYLRFQKRQRDAMTVADRSALERLDDYFQPHNLRLADSFGLELSAW